MLGRIRGSRTAFRTAFPTALVIGATLALSGCGGPQEAGAAAIVGDRVIKDSDVQSVAEQFNKLVTGEGKKVTTREILVLLILAPNILDEARRAGKFASESQARTALAKVSDPTAATVEYVQIRLALEKQFDQASQAAVMSGLGKVKITVNPRYGAFDAKALSLTPTAPNWIKAAATSPAN